MGLKEDKTISDIVQAVRESDAKKTKGYDTQATVIRVEDGKAWVHIPGGVPETPAELTINAQPGDSVMVRLAGGRAFLLGNATSPPTDDATAKEALSNAADALQSAVSAKLAADSAEASAATASAAAQDAVETAEAVHGIAEQAQADAETAKTNAQTAITNAAAAQAAAGAAQTSADNAQAQAASATASANGALNGLSTVQDVIGVLDWAKDNATYTLTSDTDIEPGKTYWTRSGSGTEADPYTYTPVVTPVKADLGTYYEVSGVDEAMADFINTHLALTDEGLYVMKDGSAWKVQISDDGVYILDPTGVPANQMTGNGNIVGYDGETHVEIDYHSLQLIDKEGDTYFHVSDLRDKNGELSVTEYRLGSEINYIRSFFTLYRVKSDLVVTVDGIIQEEGVDYSVSPVISGTQIQFESGHTPPLSASVVFDYVTESINTKAFTLGTRKEGASIGGYSTVIGYECAASGLYNYAEGYKTEAVSQGSSYAAHAEGESTQALARASHAEGYETIAEGGFSHAEGWNTKAIGGASHAGGRGTIACSDEQTVIGKYNIEDLKVETFTGNGSKTEFTLERYVTGQEVFSVTINGTATNSYDMVYTDPSALRFETAPSNGAIIKITYVAQEKAFIIGNGTSTDRSNAFSVDWDGNVEASGDVNAVDGAFSGDVSGTDITASGNVQATTAKLDISKYTTTGNVDKTIYDALNSLGWLSDCTES